jgi:hypothetical protein
VVPRFCDPAVPRRVPQKGEASDAVAGLAIAGVAVREGLEAWRGENCCDVPGLGVVAECECGPGCTDSCCAASETLASASGAGTGETVRT